MDRDGVINEDFGYVHTPERLKFVDGIFDLCKLAQSSKFKIIIVTNQAGIGRGYYTEAEFLVFMNHVKKKFKENSIEVDAIYFCPHHPEYGVGSYRRECSSRKPNSGMLLKAIVDFDLDPELCIMIGDQETDMKAALRSKIKRRYLFSQRPMNYTDTYFEVIKSLESVDLDFEDKGNDK